MVGIFCSFYQKVVGALVNGIIIKVYKYACKYNRVGVQFDLRGLVIQPAVGFF